MADWENEPDREPRIYYVREKEGSGHSNNLGVILGVIAVGGISAFLLYYFLNRSLRLTHLGSGKMKASGSEEPIFIFEATHPFSFCGWVNLKEMTEGDKVVIKEYVKLGIDKEYGSWGGREFEGVQKDPMLRIAPDEALHGIKITLQQTAGVFKPFEWEFYKGVTG